MLSAKIEATREEEEKAGWTSLSDPCFDCSHITLHTIFNHQMSIFNRLGRLPARNVHKWIHTSAYLRTAATESPAKPHIDSSSSSKTTSLLDSKHHGRHRSSKLKQTMAKATLPGNLSSVLVSSVDCLICV